MNDQEFKNNQRINYKEWYGKFKVQYEDFERWLTQRTFNEWLRSYFDYKKIEYSSVSTNGMRMYELKMDTQQQEQQEDNDNIDPWDEIENDLGL